MTSISPSFNNSILTTAPYSANEEIKNLKKELKVLIEQKEDLEKDQLEQWYEDFFALEKKVHDFKKENSSFETNNSLKELSELFNLNEKMPRVKDLAKQLLDPSWLNFSLKVLLSTLCTHYQWSNDELGIDEELFQISRFESEAIFVKRLIKSARTNLPLSLIAAVERTWKKKENSNQEGETITFDLSDKKCRVIFLPQKAKVFLKEELLGEGKSKAVFAASSLLDLKNEKNRSTFAILEHVSSIKKELKENEINPSLLDQQNVSDNSFQSSINYHEREAENCLKYSELQGIWPTLFVEKVDGISAIFQEKAAYIADDPSCIAADLIDMCAFLEKKRLSIQDQKTFIDMLENVLFGVKTLHQKNIIHRDLKPENILCSKDGTAGISDLETICASIKTDDLGKKIHNPEKKGLVGTADYMPPEANWKEADADWEEIDTSFDIWSIGLILWKTFSGQRLRKHPVHSMLPKKISNSSIVKKISKLLYNKNNKGSNYLRDYPAPEEKSSLAYLVWWCTRPEPTERPSIDKVIAHYEKWADYTHDKLENGEIASIYETFYDSVGESSYDSV